MRRRAAVRGRPVLVRKAAVEGVGTALLLAAVVGSGIMAERLAGGNAAVALLANSLATGGALLALISAFGPLSGAHFNPLVTLALAGRGTFKRREASAYATAQAIGAIVGTVAANLMFDHGAIEFSTRDRSGAGQLLGELVATFGLLSIVLACGPRLAAAAVAGYIAAAYWFTSSTSFANPAVTLARSLTDSFAGIRPADAPLFIAAQVAGALLSFAFIRWVNPVPEAA